MWWRIIKPYKTMNILTDKYLSPDETKLILLYASPSSVISFCGTNKLPHGICNNLNFWIKYLSADQFKYNELLFSIAENGKLKLFKLLWANLKINVISEPKMLTPLFDIAVTNGHDNMANYIYILNGMWHNLMSRNNHSLYSRNLLFAITTVYDEWNGAGGITKNRRMINAADEDKYIIILTDAVISGKVEYIRALLIENRDLARDISVNNPLAYCKSLSLLLSLVELAKDLGYRANREAILSEALRNANYTLARKILKAELVEVHVLLLEPLLESKSPYSLSFAKKYILDKVPKEYWTTYYPSIIGNKYVLYEILEEVDNNRVNAIIENSYMAFVDDPLEYVELVKDNIKQSQITDRYRDHIAANMWQAGEYYMAKVFVENIMLRA